MRSLGLAVLAVLVSVGSAEAQNETALRAALEGQVVTVKIDMPATSRGVDVFPQEQIPSTSAKSRSASRTTARRCAWV